MNRRFLFCELVWTRHLQHIFGGPSAVNVRRVTRCDVRPPSIVGLDVIYFASSPV